MGITVCVATGDHGSGDNVNDCRDHVDFPACRETGVVGICLTGSSSGRRS
jgi:hypothetical protein